MDITYYKKYEPIFGSWHIVREIGEGSFGKVFEIQREDFGVTYKAALKAITVPQSQSEIDRIMDDGMDKDSVTAYFRGFVQELVEEFRIMSKLKGESNVVSYEDHMVIEHTDGVGWDILIRMELLTPLTKQTKENALEREDVIRLGTDICKALELCRNYNIIHRDIKPENVFISENGRFKLGDFGIAKTVEKTTGGLSKKGTYTYMAPEVYRGEKYGAGVDIYSLGIMLYRYMNNSRTPFLPAFPQAISYTDRENAMVRRLRGESMPAPVNADPELAAIILKACAFDPKDRFASATEMREALEKAAKTAPVSASDKTAVGYEEGNKTVLLYDEAAVPAAENLSEAVTVPEAPAEKKKPDLPGEETVVEAPVKQADGTVCIFDTGKEMMPEEETVSENETVSIAEEENIAAATEAIDEKTPAEKSYASAPQASKKKKGSRKKRGIAILAVAILAIAALIGIFHSNKWTDIIAVSTGSTHTVGLKSDGTVVAVGDNRSGRCEVSDWTDIIAVSVGSNHTVGLKSDGTVVAVGDNSYCKSDVSGWTDIIAISAGSSHTVGLKSDGTVVAVGNNSSGRCEVSDWTDIIAVSTSHYHTVGLKSDGTVVAVGNNGSGRCEVSDWTDIIAVSAGSSHTVGLKSDGTVVAVGNNNNGQCEVSNWTDIIAVSAGSSYTVGLKSDGTVVAVGINRSGQCNVSDWTDIIAVSTGWFHTVGLKSDGTVVAVGDNVNGQCDVGGR